MELRSIKSQCRGIGLHLILNVNLVNKLKNPVYTHQPDHVKPLKFQVNSHHISGSQFELRIENARFILTEKKKYTYVVWELSD